MVWTLVILLGFHPRQCLVVHGILVENGVKVQGVVGRVGEAVHARIEVSLLYVSLFATRAADHGYSRRRGVVVDGEGGHLLASVPAYHLFLPN